MKTALTIVGGILILVGIVWILQGINILPGSFMTGQSKWAIYGVVSFLIGLGLLAYNSRRGTSRR